MGGVIHLTRDHDSTLPLIDHIDVDLTVIMAHSAVIAFDLYGTLLSTESISTRLTEIIGSQEKGAQIAASWRKYQLEYSWRLTCMGMFQALRTIGIIAEH